MKKIFAFLLIFFLMTPVISALCDCCPMSASSQIRFENPHHNCCPTMESSTERCKIERSESFTLPSSFVPRPLFLSIEKIGGRLLDGLTSLSFGRDVGPPLFDLETPLYLQLNTLRI